MNQYKIYGGLKYLIHDGKKYTFKFVSYEEKKLKTKKQCRKKRKKTRKKILTF